MYCARWLSTSAMQCNYQPMRLPSSCAHGNSAEKARKPRKSILRTVSAPAVKRWARDCLQPGCSKPSGGTTCISARSEMWYVCPSKLPNTPSGPFTPMLKRSFRRNKSTSCSVWRRFRPWQWITSAANITCAACWILLGRSPQPITAKKPWNEWQRPSGRSHPKFRLLSSCTVMPKAGI